MTSCSPPSRRGLATAACEAIAERRPSLTASARDVVGDGRSGRRNGTSVEPRNAKGSARLRYRDRGGGRRRFAVPRSAAGHDGIGKDEQLPGAGDERAFVFLSGRDQPLVKGDELLVPAKRCRQGRGIKRQA